MSEKELKMPDYRRQGLTMNWKKARELYKKMTKTFSKHTKRNTAPARS